jgi:hypothetical protein
MLEHASEEMLRALNMRWPQRIIAWMTVAGTRGTRGEPREDWAQLRESVVDRAIQLRRDGTSRGFESLLIVECRVVPIDIEGETRSYQLARRM